jgi:hypothetical protein
MRIARKTMLLALMAAAAMMLAASAASAQSVEATIEATGEHCPPVTSPTDGGCLGKATGEASLVGHGFGIEVVASDCNITVEGRGDEDGEGYIYSATYTGDASHNCTRTPCGLPWRAHGEETSPGVESGTVEWCARPSSGPDNRCLATDSGSDDGDHEYSHVVNDVSGIAHSGPDCELTNGSGVVVVDAAHPAVEVIHTGE